MKVIYNTAGNEEMDLGKPIASGNTAEVYLCDGKIVKLFKDFLPDTEAEYEANKQRYAYSLGLPVPFVFEVTKVNGRQAFIMEYIEGRTLGSLIYDNMATVERYMGLSVDLQIKMHRTRANGIEPMSEKLRRQLSSAHLLSDKSKSELIDKLCSIQHDEFLCHGDYHIFNLIDGKNGTVIIDWVDSSAGDPRADAYRTYLLYSQYSDELVNLYIKLYCEKSEYSQNDILDLFNNSVSYRGTYGPDKSRKIHSILPFFSGSCSKPEGY